MVRLIFGKRPSIAIFSAALFAVALLISSAAQGQVTGATLSGTVIDATGGAIADAKISIQNTATATIRSSVTDSAGFYRKGTFDLLPIAVPPRGSARRLYQELGWWSRFSSHI